MKTKIVLVTALVTGALIGLLAARSDYRVTPDTPVSAVGSSAVSGQRAAPMAVARPQQPQAPAPAPNSGSDCNIVTHYLPNDDGTVTEVYRCEPTVAAARHPYEDYSNETLESLAYSEPLAAEILGMRLREKDEALAMSLMIRASALSDGDLEPLVRYFNAYPQPTSIDGEAVPDTARTQFVLLTVMELLSDEPYDLSRWSDRIREFSLDPEREIAALRRQAERIVEEMRQIQLEVTGETSLGG